jgi:hypothetical protein
MVSFDFPPYFVRKADSAINFPLNPNTMIPALLAD